MKNAEAACKAFGLVDVRELFSSDEGILTGAGGGYTLRFTDFIIGTQGETTLSHYTINPDTGQQTNRQSARLLLMNRSKKFERLIEKVLEVDFFGIELPPPTSLTIRQTALAHPEHGVHHLVWAVDASPTPPRELVELDLKIRNFLTESFTEEFGN